MSDRFEKKIIFNNDYLKENNVSNVYSFNIDLIDREPGIYIFINRKTKEAYVGRAVDIFTRLQTHIKHAFSNDFKSETNAYKILIEDDVEMYCCFLKDTYDYNEVEDYKYELSILEGLTMDAVKNSGFNLVNKNFVNYEINNLTDIEYFKNNIGIVLTHNLFENGLKDFLRIKTTSKDFIEDNSHNKDVDFLNYKIEYLNRKLKNEEYERRSAKAKINRFKLENLEYSSINKKLLRDLDTYKNENKELINSLTSCEDNIHFLKNKNRNRFKYIMTKNIFHHKYKGFKFLDNSKFNEFINKTKKTPTYYKYKKILNTILNNPEYFSLKINYLTILSNKIIWDYVSIRTSITITSLNKYNKEVLDKNKIEIVNEYASLLYELICDLIITLKGRIPEDILNDNI